MRAAAEGQTVSRTPNSKQQMPLPKPPWTRERNPADREILLTLFPSVGESELDLLLRHELKDLELDGCVAFFQDRVECGRPRNPFVFQCFELKFTTPR